LEPAPRPAPPPPPAPAPAPRPFVKVEPLPAPLAQDKVIVKEIHETIQDEIIELGEDARRDEPPVAASPAPLVAKAPEARVTPPSRLQAEEIVEAREAPPEKKAPPADNPNEVGDYVLLGMIARGGMAEIYKAKKKGVKGFEKVIAIKKILSGYGEDDKYIEMLVDEAKIAAELSHPNIVQIYDLGRKDNYYFIAMEYVLGKDLREIQTRLRERDKWFPEEIAIYLTSKILEALNYAHKAKDSRGRPLEIVHRDVSPPNILISYNGDVKLTDFGVSKASIKIHQTLSGALKGKLLYMSPEQACGESTIDYRSDLYSAGVVLFELLTGKKLFLDTSEMTVLKKVQNGEIINPREINPDIDPALEKILLTSLSKECDKRYQSAGAMIADLEAYIHRKYDRASGPVHLAHFIYGLFEGDIHREGIKVDLKPLPYTPKAREIAKPQPPPEKPKPAMEIPVILPPAPPPVSHPPQPEGLVSINFDDDKAPFAGKKPAAEDKAAFKPDSLFKDLEKEKKRFPWLPLATVLMLGAVGAGVYFLVFNKPAAPAVLKPAAQGQPAATAAGQASGLPAPANSQGAAMKKIADELAATQKLIDEAKLKQEEELTKLQAEEEKKKLQDERRKKTEADRLKKEEEDRLKQEEDARLLQEEENRKKQQDEADRLKAEDERKKADEAKRAELNRVKEGDVVSLGEVDTPPVAVSTPGPNIPASIRSSMADSVAVMFTILINHNGDVETVRMLQKSNNSQLNTILTELIKGWKYQPAVKNSVRVKVWKTVPMSIKK
jgi:serine/threonine protein kinase/outer membrane biosynthesis protein TonB